VDNTKFRELRIVIILLLVWLTSCNITRKSESNISTDNDSIFFVVFSIRKDPNNAKHIVELVSKTQSAGTIKKQNRNTAQSSNFLTIFVYNDKNLSDTMTIAHPLYKHIEYLDENNSFAVKDTVIDKAEFFLRIQAQGHSNRIRLFETLNNKPREELTSIKL
jgi:hypothetical protein